MADPTVPPHIVPAVPAPPVPPAPASLVPAPGQAAPAVLAALQAHVGYQLNWSHFGPEFSGKPEEDTEAHLLHTNEMNIHNISGNVKVQRFCLALVGETRLWYESLRLIALIATPFLKVGDEPNHSSKHSKKGVTFDALERIKRNNNSIDKVTSLVSKMNMKMINIRPNTSHKSTKAEGEARIDVTTGPQLSNQK